MDKKLRIAYLTFPFTLAAIQTIMVLLLSNLSTCIMGLRWEAVVDLFVFLPVTLAYLLVFLKSSTAKPVNYTNLLTIFGIIFAVGHGMHLAANQIHNVVDSIESVLVPVSTAAYLWDELIGHWLIHIGLAGILILQALFVGPKTIGKGRLLTLRIKEARFTVTGLCLGVFLAIAAIEGHSVGVYTAYILIVWWIIVLRMIHDRELASYMFATSIGLLTVFTFWYIHFGGFIEPSQLWKLGRIG